MMDKICYKLETFEGPLDLLLALIAKNKLDIFNIQITELVDQYLEQLAAMRERRMDVTSEFLEMAARLIYLKTVSLLPKHEETERLKCELTGQLIEYQSCKRAAAQLGERFSFDSYTRGPEKMLPDRRYHGHFTLKELYAAYLSAAGRGKRFLPPPQEAFSAIVSHRIVSVSSRIIYVLRRLRLRTEQRYEALFDGIHNHSERVATFLAVLELIKGGRIALNGDQNPKVKLLNGGGKHGD
ncbi:MAG: segregation/condensation protein A [Oscillospiraceae bacterium]|jgi:segregation and condensation protein A|nr:segregation/condensation protein A [Oscillospiraceae bacterium]